MMNTLTEHLLNILIFILSNVSGLAAIILIGAISMTFGLASKLQDQNPQDFMWQYFYIGIWVWMAMALCSILYFFLKTKRSKYIALLAPVYVPALYSIIIVLRYSL